MNIIVYGLSHRYISGVSYYWREHVFINWDGVEGRPNSHGPPPPLWGPGPSARHASVHGAARTALNGWSTGPRDGAWGCGGSECM